MTLALLCLFPFIVLRLVQDKVSILLSSHGNIQRKNKKPPLFISHWDELGYMPSSILITDKGIKLS